MIFRHAQQRIRRWWHARLPLSDTLVLRQHRVYILPSRAGWLLAATLVVLLVASINYQLNLGYLLTFLLFGCALAGMYVSHATLLGLRLSLEPPHPQFAGSSATLSIVLANDRRRARHAIGLAVLDAPRARHWVWYDVPAQGSVTARVAFQPRRRGLHQAPILLVQTHFPLGTFRVWSLWRPAARVLVWPTPEPYPPPLPPGEPRAGAGASRAAPSGEFDGVRSYRRGDALKQVVWKKVARAGELVSRDTHQAQRHELWLDHAQAGHADLESRLSRLAAWVLQADRLGLDYGLRLPGRQLPPGSGPAHKHRCLEALALC